VFKSKKQTKVTKSLKECTYYIDGMHCSSCEVLIEKKLLKQKNIKKADASLTDGKVEFEYIGEKPTAISLTSIFKETGYTFSERKRENEIRMFRITNGNLVINKAKLKRASIAIFITLLILAAFYFLQKTGLASKIVLNETSTYPSFFLFGVLAGLSSCAALVGGLLLSMSKQWGEMYIDSNSKLEKLKPFTMFNIGRLVSFTILGGLLGAVGSALGISINRTPLISAIVIIIVSLIMFILGLQMLEVKWAYKIKIALPKFLTRSVSSEEKFKGRYMPLLVGALTFFLPCGFTIIAQGLALASGSLLKGSLMMLSFALGTLPVLAIISFTSSRLSSKPKFNKIFNSVAGILVIIFAIYNLNSQLNLLGLKSLNDIKLPNISSFGKTITELPNVETNSDGVQVVRIEAQGFAYRFTDGSIIQAGKPAKLVVNNKGVSGCAVTLSVSGLLKSYVYLNYGENIIDLGMPSKGSYKITCSMGMVTPIILKAV
jgi:sulfite exporter TauE/SafE/copper chaperone CopZ